MNRIGRTRLHRIAIGGAWLFMLVSLMQLGGAVVVKMGNPGEVTRLFGEGAWGLTYSGATGLVQAIVQAGVVMGAFLCTLPPLQRRNRLRRVGHSVLTVWSAWWMFNLIWQFGVDSHVSSLMQAALYTALFGCTAYRAACRWSGRAPASALPRSIEVSWGLSEDDALLSEHVSGSARVTDVTAVLASGDAASVREKGRLAAAARTAGRRLVSHLRPLATTARERLRSTAARLRAHRPGSATVAPPADGPAL